uniref:Uncharacterized protein n=2 Tax=Desulfobacterium TaxID=2295 RepID=E1Y9K2_9BACT|nr:hypothetical protein N47_A12750 [uncultured Desulfobacterium sp.]
MNIQEKTLARYFFQNKILKADGQAFEDIFTAIMNYAEAGFQSIKPWGNIGDRKNDGYIKTKVSLFLKPFKHGFKILRYFFTKHKKMACKMHCNLYTKYFKHLRQLLLDFPPFS